MLVEQQIAERQARARSAVVRVIMRPTGGIYGDSKIKSALHGAVPSRKRGALIDRFQNDPNCKVFLFTDAGGVGLAEVVRLGDRPWFLSFRMRHSALSAATS